MKKRNVWNSVVLAVAMVLSFGQVPTFADEFSDHLNISYDFTNWVGKTEINYSCLVTNWVPQFSAFATTNLIAKEEGIWINRLKDSDYFFHPTGGSDATVSIRIKERPSVADAHMAMMETFGNCSAIQPSPLGTTKTLKIGDRCYLGYPEKAFSHIFFVRNNVFISISSNRTNCPVNTIAADLDDQLLSLSKCK